MLKRIVYILLSIAWMSLIFILSAKNADASGADSMFITERIIRLFFDNPSQMFIDITEVVIRKLAHFTEYAILACLYYLTMRSFGCSTKMASLSVIFSFIYAVSDELHQFFVPGRACRLYDIIIDTLGAATGYFVMLFLSCFNRKYMNKN